MSLFPFMSEQVEIKNNDIYKEYEFDFNTGQLTGKILEDKAALKMWIYKVLLTSRYVHPIYSWDYGQDLEELIGRGYEKGFIKTTTYFERAEKEVNLDKEEAIKTATEQLTKSFERTLSNDYKIADKDVYTEDIGEGKLRVKVTFVVEQDIASVS